MKLHWSPRSPFVRKVMVAAHDIGVADRIQTVRTVAAMTKPHPDLMIDNPLSKIPTLVLDNGTVLYDSNVICEYLDHLNGGPKLFPVPFEERMTALRRQALGDGIHGRHAALGIGDNDGITNACQRGLPVLPLQALGPGRLLLALVQGTDEEGDEQEEIQPQQLCR